MDLSRVAIKQLTASDLSFFAVHLRRSKQKAINLNANVFVERFYPGLRGRTDEIRFRLNILGPGSYGAYVLTRKATRTPGAKNWRLNGELVHELATETGRFAQLQDDDFAVLAFEGTEHPDIVTLVLVSAQADAALHAAIAAQFSFAGKDTMVAVTQAQLAGFLEATRAVYADHHPFETLLLPDTAEEAIFGTAESQTRTAQTDGRGATVSPETLRQHLRAAEETGEQGEALFDTWLSATGHGEDDYEWVSRTHARATHDFHVRHPRWAGGHGAVFVDVKTTRGPLDSPIHMSMAEIRWAATHPDHIIARVYGVGTPSPKLALLTGVHDLARRIVDEVVAVIPPGVAIDGFELKVTSFTTTFATDLLSDLD